MKVFIIAEVGINHDGSFDKAQRLIYEAKQAGADAVKFQTFLAEDLASIKTPKAAYQEATTGTGSQYSMLKNLELTRSQFIALKGFADSVDIEFMSTPFDRNSLKFLVNEIGVRRLKISSGDLTNMPLVHEAGKSQLPTILSTGGAILKEIDQSLIAWKFGRDGRNPKRSDFLDTQVIFHEFLEEDNLKDITLLHCTSQYPARLGNLNLRVMNTLKDRYKCQVGYSDHSIGSVASLGAVALGASIIEKHLTEHKGDFGPDHSASMEISEFTTLVTTIRELEVALGQTQKIPSADEKQTIEVVRRSIAAARDLKLGQCVQQEDLTTLRPSGGLHPSMYWELIGKRVLRDIEKGTFLDESSFE